MEMTVMETPPRNGALGTVWIKSSASSLLSVGLEKALKKGGTTVHRGPQPPTKGAAGYGAPSVIVYSPKDEEVYSPKDEEELASGVKELKELNPQAAVVVFGAWADLSLARAAVGAEADGFLHAGMPPGQIARALHKAQNGEEVLPRELLREWVAETMAKEQGPDLAGLGERKVEILDLVAKGLTNAQIAKRLYLAESTIKQHLRAAYKRLGVKNRTEAARLLARSSDPIGGGKQGRSSTSV
jgi:DNA-binding NarL/FixJ family response regulator